MQTIQINEKQTDTLKSIVKTGKVNVIEANLDKRTVNALETRGLVKKSENKKGLFVIATAKGKKFLN
jgi:predicted transcriptional regulator